MRPSCRLGLTTAIITMLLATTSALTRRAAHSGRPLLVPAVCGFQHAAAAAASRLSAPPLPLRPLATATATVARQQQPRSAPATRTLHTHQHTLTPLAAAAGAGGGSSGGSGADGRVRSALTAAYAVGGMALALYSSLGATVGGMEGANGGKEPRMVTGSDPGAKEFYPPVEPNRTGMLKVSGIHTLYWEESGNPNGKPVVFLHGGPGGGTSPDFRRYFDPKVYRIVVFDQRGCGQSTPHACLEENTTWDLVADIERLRAHLGIERWTVFGGSWGSTLSLTYAITYPDRVTELILRGIFMLRHKELQFYYQEGSSWIYPDAFEPYEQHIPANERHDLIKAYHKRLTSKDEATRLAAAREWTRWEMATSRLLPDWASIRKADDAKYAEAFARIENHYFIHKGWFDDDAWILTNVHKIRHIPAVIVQGRYDSVCPTRSAFDLWRAWPEADLVIVQDAGHSAAEPGIRSELIKAADRFGKSNPKGDAPAGAAA